MSLKLGNFFSVEIYSNFNDRYLYVDKKIDFLVKILKDEKLKKYENVE